MEPELVIFCDQVRLWMVRIGHQPRHKIYQPVLPARSTVVVVAQSLWEWPTNDWSSLRSMSMPDTAWRTRNQRLDSPEIHTQKNKIRRGKKSQ